ncbi:hypothetical protein ACYTPF_19085 [Alteromonas sp. HB246098]
MSSYVLYVFIGIAIVLNILVSIFLSRRDDLDAFQKVAQIIVVWLFPYFASIGLWLLCKSQDSESNKRHKEFGGGWNNSGGPGTPDGGM